MQSFPDMKNGYNFQGAFWDSEGILDIASGAFDTALDSVQTASNIAQRAKSAYTDLQNIWAPSPAAPSVLPAGQTLPKPAPAPRPSQLIPDESDAAKSSIIPFAILGLGVLALIFLSD